jgi:hypothetical protein
MPPSSFSDFPVELTPQKRQGPMRRIRKPQWTQAPSPSGAASLGRGWWLDAKPKPLAIFLAPICCWNPPVLGALPDHMRSGCPICEALPGHGQISLNAHSSLWIWDHLGKPWGSWVLFLANLGNFWESCYIVDRLSLLPEANLKTPLQQGTDITFRDRCCRVSRICHAPTQ